MNIDIGSAIIDLIINLICSLIPFLVRCILNFMGFNKYKTNIKYAKEYIYLNLKNNIMNDTNMNYIIYISMINNASSKYNVDLNAIDNIQELKNRYISEIMEDTYLNSNNKKILSDKFINALDTIVNDKNIKHNKNAGEITRREYLKYVSEYQNYHYLSVKKTFICSVIILVILFVVKYIIKYF